MTGIELFAALRQRLNDVGDDTQDENGNPLPQYFWAEDELADYINGALFDIFCTLADLGFRGYKRRAEHELRNLVKTVAIDEFTPLPSDYYRGLSATVDSRAAVLIEDPNIQYDTGTTERAMVHLYGRSVVITPSGADATLTYWRMPTEIAESSDPIIEFSSPFYSACIPYAEFLATNKDNARARIILRRKVGERDLGVMETTDYLQAMAQ
jgi:hypothetical protein